MSRRKSDGYLRLCRISIDDVCQYRHGRATVCQGLTAVIGPNGSGKTNLLRGLMFGLTGMVDGSWGTQGDLQRDGAVTPGSVTVELCDHDMHSYVIYRPVRPSGQCQDRLEVDGKVVARRRKAVDAALEELLGVPMSLLFRVAWGRQGELAQLLVAPAASVSTFLAQVFDTRFVEVIRDRVKSQLDTVATLAPVTREQVDAVAAELEQLPADSVLDALESAARETRNEAFLEWDRLQTLYRDSGKERLCADLAAVQAELAGLGADETEPVNDPYPDITDAELADRVEALGKSSAEHLATARAYAEYAGKALDAANGVSRSIGTLDETRKRVMSQREDALKTLRATDGASVCPTCGRPLDSDCRDAVDAAASAARDRLDALERDLGGISSRLNELRDEQRKSMEARDGMLKRAEDEQAAAKSATDERNGLLRIRRARRIAALRAQESELNERISQCPDDGEVIAAQGRYTSAEEMLSKALAARSETGARRELLSRMLDETRAAHEQYKLNSRARATLAEVRDILSQSRAQAYYMSCRINELNLSLAHYQKQTDMPFTLRLDPESRTFIATTEQGYDHPACHLSGAQRSMAAVALQMAVMRVLPLRLNLYMVDEPAEALDDANKVVMGQLFYQMRDILSAVSGTMLVVTRDAHVIAACNQTIDTQDMEAGDE